MALSRKKQLIILAMFPLAYLLSNCSPIVMTASFSGQIIDSQTGVPVEDAIVVALWGLVAFHPGAIDIFEAKESLSDRNGHFTIEGWGPRINWEVGGVERHPAIIVFKDGYLPAFIASQHEPSLPFFYRKPQVPAHKSPIVLQQFAGSLADYVKRLTYVYSAIGHLVRDADCGWTKIPQLLAALHKIGFSSLPTHQIGRSIIIDRIPKKNGCPDPHAYVKEYLK